jgi:hypothetical protein
VNVSKNENYLLVYAGALSGNVPSNTLFNTKFNPFELLKLNADLLGASVNKLQFTASDANKDIVFDGERIDGNYVIPEETKLFDAINYDLSSRNIKDLPAGDNINGLVKIHYKEKIYEGFIKEISKNPAEEKETQWILFKKYIMRPPTVFTFENGETKKDYTATHYIQDIDFIFVSLIDGEPDYDIAIEGGQAWCAVSINGNNIKIALTYTNSTRSANIKLIQNKRGYELILNLTQKGAMD